MAGSLASQWQATSAKMLLQAYPRHSAAHHIRVAPRNAGNDRVGRQACSNVNPLHLGARPSWAAAIACCCAVARQLHCYERQCPKVCA